MSITQDDVGRVLDTYGEMYVKDDAIVKSEMPLVDFANHFYELGRKMQRESDAKLARLQGDAEAIRNNTGDLT